MRRLNAHPVRDVPKIAFISNASVSKEMELPNNPMDNAYTKINGVIAEFLIKYSVFLAISSRLISPKNLLILLLMFCSLYESVLFVRLFGGDKLQDCFSFI